MEKCETGEGGERSTRDAAIASFSCRMISMWESNFDSIKVSHDSFWRGGGSKSLA